MDLVIVLHHEAAVDVLFEGPHAAGHLVKIDPLDSVRKIRFSTWFQLKIEHSLTESVRLIKVIVEDI